MASKGKGREENHWQLNWCDIQLLVEGSRRPVSWTKSSTIWTAHPTQPLILARHFPSSTQFIIPSPSPVVTSLASYDPPTIISVAPTDDSLFAYFPGRGREGVGCIWNRGSQLNAWTVSEWWSFAPGDGVVTAEWAGSEREWVVSDSGSSTRLPPKGPMLHFSKPLLLLVTQTHHLHLCYFSSQAPSLRIVKASLFRSNIAIEGQTNEDLPPSVGGERVCSRAAIGFNYNDTTILVATRSHILPTIHSHHASFPSMDLGLPLDVSVQDASEDIFSPKWEILGEEATIHLCEVQVEVKNASLGLVTKAHAPLSHSGEHLIDLKFITLPPRPETPPSIYLSATSVDFHDYTSTPSSQLALFSFAEISGTGRSSARRIKLRSTRNFDNAVLNFVVPLMAEEVLLVGLLDAAGSVSAKQSRLKEAPIGHIEALKLSDLSVDDSWDQQPILTKVENVGWDIPINVAISPNRSLLCSVSSSVLQSTHTSIHTLPRPLEEASLPDSKNHHRTVGIARRIVTALHARRAPYDACHTLTLPATPFEAASSALHNSLVMLTSHSSGLTDTWISQILGVALEVFRVKARNAIVESEKLHLEARWKVVHDMCSLSACCNAFELCREASNTYDLDAIWQLVSLSSWFLEFLENVFKEGILAGMSGPQEVDPKAISQSSTPSLSAPILLHLIHPYTLTKLAIFVGHIQRLRDYVASLNPSVENSRLAKDVLMDVVDSSGINLNRVEPTLADLLRNASSMGNEELRMSLLSCNLRPQVIPRVQAAVNTIVQSNAIDKPRLFIKPGDLVDGVSHLSLSDQRSSKGNETDVISKGLLLPGRSSSTCTRCGGRSQVAGLGDLPPPSQSSALWHSWERQWAMRCLCGGYWTRTAA